MELLRTGEEMVHPSCLSFTRIVSAAEAGLMYYLIMPLCRLGHFSINNSCQHNINEHLRTRLIFSYSLGALGA